MKIIGYGICGPGEARRYMRDTLDEFKRLCDDVVILCNNTSREEDAIIDEYGFKRVSDRRVWGQFQWRIKQDFMERDIKQIAEPGDVLICLDMDETFDHRLTREWLLSMELDAYHVYVVDLWNDTEHYKPESCFWNVRIWRWNGETEFKPKPVHCGLAPQWTYFYHRFAPFLLIHKGLMLKEDRERKIARYEKYDPKAEHLDRKYYRMLASDTAVPFDEEAMHETIAKELATYKQSKPRPMPEKKKEKFFYVQNPHGIVVDIPERHLQETMKRPGFKLIGPADDAQKEMQELFEDEEVGEPVIAPPGPPGGSYHRSTEDEAKEVSDRIQKDEDDLLSTGEPADEITEDDLARAATTGPTPPENQPGEEETTEVPTDTTPVETPDPEANKAPGKTTSKGTKGRKHAGKKD